MFYSIVQNDPLYLIIVGTTFFAWVSTYCLWNARQNRRKKEAAMRRRNEIQIWE